MPYSVSLPASALQIIVIFKFYARELGAPAARGIREKINRHTRAINASEVDSGLRVLPSKVAPVT